MAHHTSTRWHFGLDVVVSLLAMTSLLPRAMAQAPGPGGVNVGFDFDWGLNVDGCTASFIESSGTSLNNCVGGAVTGTTRGCNFVFAYSIDGTPQPSATPGGDYQTWTGANGATGRFCSAGGNTAPLTLFNCFNQNSFGQLFVPSVSGSLTALSMPMTCLNPAAATPPTGLFALLYETTNSGRNLPSAPLATTPVDLSTCPTLTSWQDHTFSAADFATIALNFSGVTLTAGNVYGVFFGGLVPGTALPGTPTVTSVTPSSGALSGGATVSITGTNFTGATSVTFGGVAAPSFSVVNDTSITCTVPSGVSANAVSVVVTTPNGTNNANSLYTYLPAPVPTLGEWGMILMALLLGAAGIVALRRRCKGAAAV